MQSLVAVCLVLAGGAWTGSWGGPLERETVRVFLDCSRGCDRSYILEQVHFVDFVRDRRDADVHLLITRERAGSSWRYTVEFLGVGELAGEDARLEYDDPDTSTSHERREGLTRTIARGLVRYVADRPVGRHLRIGYEPEGAGEAAARTPADDRWNLWVFRLRGNGSLRAEATSGDLTLYASISAYRTTHDWKVRLSSDGRLRDRRFTLSDGSEVTSESRTYGTQALVVRGVSDHLSFGALASVRSSTFLNQAIGSRAATAVEYNYFPYMEATRRQLTFLYSVGANYFDYFERTVYDQDREFLADHNLVVSYDVEEPWGSANLTLEASNYFHDFDKHRVDFSSGASVRVLRGLSLDASAAAALIRDQLYLAAGDASPEEVLLRRRQLQTSYRYSGSLGFTYSFGSIFDNVVNPRFTGSSRTF
jgi:hypothetical protein